ncbi:MAG: hypothetical protein JRC92_11425, partial [Deltaproteobacteria bacterium]|nr:hypothetical protein [Deltaproteobacteria bacterium]
LDTMTHKKPIAELDSYTIEVPADQNVPVNGLAVVLHLYGIPNIPKISLYFNFHWANPSLEMTVSG